LVVSRSGTWVLANIRGGGEFGPAWHTTRAARGRKKTHDDFIAVAEDLISPRHLFTQAPRHHGRKPGWASGGSNVTQRPELFKAVVCQVPPPRHAPLQQAPRRSSWMGEYGNPTIPRTGIHLDYSPYQNVVKEKKYPRVLFTTTNARRPRHPGHARKMVAKMKDQGHDVLYFEYTEGGHAAGSTPAQQAYHVGVDVHVLLNELK